MNHPLDESLSALVDHETSAFETRRLHNLLCSGSAELARWERYHLIGQSMRGNLSGALRKDFAVGVMLRLDEASVVPQRPAGSAPRRFTQSAAGLAVAASIAVVTVLGVQSFTTPTAPLTPLSSGSPASPSSMIAQVDPAAPDLRRVKAKTVVPASRGTSPRLSSYLVNHAEFAARQGMMPYARIVSYDMTEAGQ